MHAFGCLDVEHVAAAVQSGDEGVALESCEFWSAFCEAAVSQPETLSPDVLRPFLGRLVPVLLKNMVRASWPLATRSSMSIPLDTSDDVTCHDVRLHNN